jgi:hypothetical protein
VFNEEINLYKYQSEKRFHEPAGGYVWIQAKQDVLQDPGSESSPTVDFNTK